jgi:hypothetical protein
MGGAMAAPEPAPERIRTGTWPESIQSRCVEPSDLGLEPTTPDCAGGLHRRCGHATAPADGLDAQPGVDDHRSFLVKHLLTDWRKGEAWFWDTLVDADPANDAFSW